MNNIFQFKSRYEINTARKKELQAYAKKLNNESLVLAYGEIKIAISILAQNPNTSQEFVNQSRKEYILEQELLRRLGKRKKTHDQSF